MGRLNIFLFLLIVVAMGVSSGIDRRPTTAKAASEMVPPPEEIVVLYPVGDPETGAVIPKTFTHKEHSENYSIACSVCHHVYESGENVWEEGMPVERCMECHEASKMGVDEKLVPGIQLKKLIIQGTCSDCHKTISG
jgi:cytochrome c peroxidase